MTWLSEAELLARSEYTLCSSLFTSNNLVWTNTTVWVPNAINNMTVTHAYLKSTYLKDFDRAACCLKNFTLNEIDSSASFGHMTIYYQMVGCLQK